MKNYRELKKFKHTEWENDNEWKGKRLSFLWNVRDYKPDTYRSLRLVEEKNSFYEKDVDYKIRRVANEDYNSVDRKYYDKVYSGVSTETMQEELERLESLLETNFNEFLLKKNCNLYEYFKILQAEGIL